MGGCLDSWVGQWVGLGQMTNNFINLYIIKIIQFCLKIYDFYIGWVVDKACIYTMKGQ